MCQKHHCPVAARHDNVYYIVKTAVVQERRSTMEIERKFLLKNIPENLEKYESKKIAQGYLCTAPVVRIRRSNDDYYLTYKGAGLMSREEYNLPLTRESYEHLLPKIDGLLIAKTRYLIPLWDGLTAELDIFEDELAPLSLVEVEFETEEVANSFTPPDWFGEDVTQDGRYHNSYLSRFANS
jgi:CYTH domain-containing protein